MTFSEHYTGDYQPYYPDMSLKEIDDLLETIQRLAAIGRILIDHNNDYLLPTALESLYEKAQELVEYCIKNEV